MKKILALFVMCVCLTTAHAQFLKNLKSKVDQSAKDVKDKVKKKAETSPDRVIDHAANKVETKADSKIDNKENKANNKVDKTVDKVDSIKIKKTKTEEAKDTSQNKTGVNFPGNLKRRKQAVTDTAMLFYNFNITRALFFCNPWYIFI
jgi:exonuclease VII large subunit